MLLEWAIRGLPPPRKLFERQVATCLASSKEVVKTVYASPSRVDFHLDSKKEVETTPAHPDICFEVDDFDSTFDAVVLIETDHCYCVLLNAHNGAAFPSEKATDDCSSIAIANLRSHMAKTKINQPTFKSKVRVRHCCSIGNLVKLTSSLNEASRALIAQTPFHFLLHLPTTEPNSALLYSLIDGWDFDHNAFPFGPTLVPFTPTDVAYILGLRVLGTCVPVDHDYGMSRVHNLLESVFPGKSIRAELLYELVGKIQSPDDVCRVYLAYAFCTYLFSLTNKGVYGHFFRLLDDLEGLHKYGWGKAVYDFLLIGIKQAVIALKHKKCVTEIRIKGCGPLLQLWALEHTLIVDQPVQMWPRIRKWTTKNLSNSTAMTIVGVSDGNQVVIGLKPTSKEKYKKVIMELLGSNNPSSTPSNSPKVDAASSQPADNPNEYCSPASCSPPPYVPQSMGAESPHVCEFKSIYEHLLAENKELGDTFCHKCIKYDELLSQNNSLKMELDNTRAAYNELLVKYSVLGPHSTEIIHQAPPSSETK